MKKIKQALLSIFVALAMLALANATGVGDNLEPQNIEIGHNGTVNTEYCMHGITPPESNITVSVEPVCKDLNGISGCQAADDILQTEFTAIPTGNIIAINGSGCTEIELTSYGAQGTYYYTVNGALGEAEITKETGGGIAYLPEMGVLGAIFVLAGASAYIAKNKK